MGNEMNWMINRISNDWKQVEHEVHRTALLPSAVGMFEMFRQILSSIFGVTC